MALENIENRRPLSTSSSTASWKKLFKSKVEPDLALQTMFSSVLIPIKDGRTIRVLQSLSNIDGEQISSRSSLHSVPISNEKMTVFFIHGVGGSAELWKPQIAYFHSRGYDIIAPDLLGHGQSSKPTFSAAYSFTDLSQDMLQIFDMFRKKRNILVGHSYGASFVTMIASERGHSVAKVVLISGGPPSPLHPESVSLFCLPLPIFAPLKPLIVRKFRSMAFHCKIKEEITFSLSAFVLRSIMKGQKWPEGDEEYHSDLMVPVLLIYGRNDKFVTFEEEKWMEETIYGSTLEVVEEAGHMVMMERPDVVNQMILRFLNRDPSTRSLVDLSQAPESSNQFSSKAEQSEQHSDHVLNSFVNKDLLHDQICAASRPTSRAASRLSRHGSEKKTKFVL